MPKISFAICKIKDPKAEPFFVARTVFGGDTHGDGRAGTMTIMEMCWTLEEAKEKMAALASEAPIHQ